MFLLNILGSLINFKYPGKMLSFTYARITFILLRERVRYIELCMFFIEVKDSKVSIHVHTFIRRLMLLNSLLYISSNSPNRSYILR